MGRRMAFCMLVGSMRGDLVRGRGIMDFGHRRVMMRYSIEALIQYSLIQTFNSHHIA